ncbi:MAG TPA: HAMP domain-containing sensor histidine kinase [Chroococcales cyanobacterium]
MIRPKIIHYGLIVLSLPLIVELGSLIAVSRRLVSVDPVVGMELRDKEMITHLDKLQYAVEDSMQSSILFFLTKSTTLLQHQQRAKEQVNRTFRELEYISRTDDDAHRQVELLVAPLQTWLQEQDGFVKGESGMGMPASFTQSKERAWSEIFGQQESWPCQFLITRVRHSTHDLAQARGGFLSQFTGFLVNLMILNLVLAAILGAFFFFMVCRRMQKLLKKSRALVAGESIDLKISGNDEINDLDRSLDQCARSVTEVELFEKDLMTIVGSELKAPLTSLQGMLFLLNQDTKGIESERALKSLERTEQSVNWLVRLVNDLLDLEQTRTAQAPLMKTYFNMENLVKAAVESAQSLAKKENVVVETYGIGGTAYGDSDRLMKVTVNLLSTAIRASALGGKIVVDFEVDGNSAQVKITDSSTGIPDTQRVKLFEQFHLQPDRVLGEDVPTGLELPLCQAIISQHNGEIGVESLARRGCVYWFKVPGKGETQTNLTAPGASTQGKKSSETGN